MLMFFRIAEIYHLCLTWTVFFLPYIQEQQSNAWVCSQKTAGAGELVLPYSGPVKTLVEHFGRRAGARADLPNTK